MSTIQNYIVGFGLSALCTFAAFAVVMQYTAGRSLFMPEKLLILIIGLSVAQFFIQMICFLHLGQEDKPRWNLITFFFAAFIVLVLVGGTVWIMHHLDQGHNLEEVYRGGVISPQTQDD